jgi:hypothetical protein
MAEVKAWKCDQGHVMGQVTRNGRGIRKLLLYREALDLTPALSTCGEGEKTQSDVDIIAVVEGYVADVRCSVCGAVRTWVPGQEAIDRLVAQVLEMRSGVLK